MKTKKRLKKPSKATREMAEAYNSNLKSTWDALYAGKNPVYEKES